jgi:predicted dehydrogenase
METPENPSRREFLKTTAATAATAAAGALAPRFTIAAERAKGANDRIGVGFIGFGARGKWAHVKFVMESMHEWRVDPVAVCDIYQPRLDEAARMTGGKPYRHYLELLADPRVDAVCIATPDRHHARQAIDAVRAGKDVYCEKPLTHWLQFDLGRKLAEETKRHEKVVQVGTQFVASDAYAKVRKLIQDGVVGKIVHVQAGYFRRGNWDQRIRIPDPHAKPGPELDWEQFLGDAPKVAFTPSRFFRWRLYWDYAGGPGTDLLVHAFTPVMRMLDLGFPQRVFGGGGSFQYGLEIPDQCNILADYPGGPSVVLMNSLSNYSGIETILRGTDGLVKMADTEHMGPGIRIVPTAKGAKEILVPWDETSADRLTVRLLANFFACVRSRQRPYSPVDTALHVHAPLCMGVMSYRDDRVVKFDPETMAIARS